MVEITVPPTYKRGQSLKLTLSDGRLVSVMPPDNVEAGGKFSWTVPNAPAPAAAPAKGGLPALKKKLSFSSNSKKSDGEATKKKSLFSRRPSFSSKSSTAQRDLLDDANKELKEAQQMVGDTTKTFYHAKAEAEIAAAKQKELEDEAAAAERAAEQAKAETNAAQVIQKQARERRMSLRSSEEEKEANAQMDEAQKKAAESAQQASKKRAAAAVAADEAAAKQAKADEAMRASSAAKQAADDAKEVADEITQAVRKADTKRWFAANRMRIIMAFVLLAALAAFAVWYTMSAEAAKEVVVVPALKPHQKIAKWVVRHVKKIKIKGPKVKAP